MYDATTVEAYSGNTKVLKNSMEFRRNICIKCFEKSKRLLIIFNSEDFCDWILFNTLDIKLSK